MCSSDASWEQDTMTTTGASFLADVIERQEGVDTVFFVDAVLRHTLMELETRGARRILAHSEKAAAYMADGYARASGKTGFCMAQAVGAANLAAGLQDAYLDRVPLVALHAGDRAAIVADLDLHAAVRVAETASARLPLRRACAPRLQPTRAPECAA